MDSGFSRRIIWLDAAISNKRPEVVASYFVQTLQSENIHPVKIRADRGTENGLVAAMQRALSDDENAFVFGSSTHNQRIERFWGYLRQTWSDFWINHFKELEGAGYYVRGNEIDRFCIQCVYLPLLRNQLEDVKGLYNNHQIRRQRMGDVVHGIPDVLYRNPEIARVERFGLPVSQSDVDVLHELCANNFTQLDADLVVVAEAIFASLNVLSPDQIDDVESAKNMYIVLNDLLKQAIFH